MIAKEGLKLVFGSVVVYVVVAACASGGGSPGGFGADPSQDASNSSGAPNDSGSGSGSSGAPNDSSGAGILDALTDPVPKASAAPNQSGSRLKAKYYVGSDGSRTLAGMHDSMLNVDCNFVSASDGTTRCMPVGATAAGNFFSDPGCAQPLGYVTQKGCAPAAYAAQFVTATAPACTTTYFYRVFQVGAPYPGQLYSGTPTSCTAQPDAGAASLRSTYDFYSLGPEVAPSTFVAATVQTDP